MTSSLFASTVVACFFVALPHMLPCPVPRTQFADGEIVVDENGRRRRFKRREGPEEEAEHGGRVVQFNEVDGAQRTTRRECPVPKPGGILGEWLGLHKDDDNNVRRRVDR
jgi:cytochrome c oxidase assembly factor 2